MMNERECEIQKEMTKLIIRKDSREERYLKLFSKEFESYISSTDYLMTKDTSSQFYFDFLTCFDSLCEKMKEFSWSTDFLAANGIPFKKIRKLYFAVA